MLGSDQVEDGAPVVGVGDHQRGPDGAAVRQFDAAHPAVVDQDPGGGAAGAQFAAGRFECLDQGGDQGLPAALRVGGAAQVVVEDGGMGGDGGGGGRGAVVAGLGGEDGPGGDGQAAVLEQVGEAAPAPAGQGRAGPGRRGGGVVPQEAGAQFAADLPAGGQELVQGGLFTGQRGQQPGPVALPGGGDVEGEAGQPEAVEAVGVEGAVADPVGDAEAAQDERQDAVRPAVAEVVHADVELVGAAAAEHVPAAAGHVVGLDHQHPVPGGRQVAGADQPAQAGADHHGVPVRSALSDPHRLTSLRRQQGQGPPVYFAVDIERQLGQPPEVLRDGRAGQEGP